LVFIIEYINGFCPLYGVLKLIKVIKMVNEILYFRDRIGFYLQTKIIKPTLLGPIGPEVESNFAYT
jgi:hypothetical protein